MFDDQPANAEDRKKVYALGVLAIVGGWGRSLEAQRVWPGRCREHLMWQHCWPGCKRSGASPAWRASRRWSKMRPPLQHGLVPTEAAALPKCPRCRRVPSGGLGHGAVAHHLQRPEPASTRPAGLHRQLIQRTPPASTQAQAGVAFSVLLCLLGSPSSATATSRWHIRSPLRLEPLRLALPAEPE